MSGNLSRSKKFAVGLFVVLFVAVAAGPLPAADEDAVSREEFEALKARLDQLEEEKKAAVDLQKWFDRITLSGVIEVEASYLSTDSDFPGGDTEESDIALATVELCIEAAIHDWITGTLVFLWEEDDTEPVDLDVGIIRLGDTERFPLYLEAGKTYPPFGNFESNFLTDPVVVEIGETRESALRVGAEFGPVDMSVTVYNGDVNETDDDHDNIENYVAALSLCREGDDFSFGVGAAYISNIADSDGLTDELAVADEVIDSVSGLNLWANVAVGPVSLLAEYVGATGKFEAGELNFTGAKARPHSWNFEAALAVTDALTIAGKYERADDVHGWQPEKRYGICASYLLYESDLASASLSLECLHGEYETSDDLEDDSVALQLAIEF